MKLEVVRDEWIRARGLRKALKEYEGLTLRHIRAVGDKGANSGETWTHVN